MVITSEIVCRTGTVRGQAKKNNVSIPRKTGKSTIVTHGTIRVNNDVNEKCFFPERKMLAITELVIIGTQCISR